MVKRPKRCGPQHCTRAAQERGGLADMLLLLLLIRKP